MILVYSEIISKRLEFVINFIFSEVIICQFKITNDIIEFKDYEGTKLNYSLEKIQKSYIITPSKLLFEESISLENKVNYEKLDVLSKIFFLISRYEEYVPHSKDEHDRFEIKNSVLKDISVPIVNIWVEDIIKGIKEVYPEFSYKSPKYKFIPTYDVDQFYAYKNKGVKLNFIGGLRDILKLNFKNLVLRYKTLSNITTDPYDHWDLFKNSNGIFFFLTSLKRTKFDKNIHPTSKQYSSFLEGFKNEQIGLHPSYFTSVDEELLQLEKSTLEKVSNKTISQSRQHYLRFEFPKTFQKIVKNNIKEEFSLGYAEEIGFRSGTCTPHHFFDLKNNIETDLKLFPLNIMDTTLVHYKKMNTNEALKKSKLLIDTIKKHNGVFTMLWHNNIFADSGREKEWVEVYKSLMKHAKE